MPAHTDDRFFGTVRRQEPVRISEEREAIVRASGIRERMSARRVAAGVFVGHQIITPIAAGGLDLEPREQLSYAEFDGRWKTRVVVEAMGE